jgi:hypothetical protein
MATMYPAPLPEAVVKDASREAERRVYDVLRAQLGPAYSVFNSVAWLAKSPGEDARDSEVDFVVVHPDRGTLLLEVKGGTICRDGVGGNSISGARRPGDGCARRRGSWKR